MSSVVVDISPLSAIEMGPTAVVGGEGRTPNETTGSNQGMVGGKRRSVRFVSLVELPSAIGPITPSKNYSAEKHV
jgi:hypothetical protein